MHDRHDLTDEWVRLEPLLPDRTPCRGGRWLDHRPVIDGVLWRTRTGSPWRDLPFSYAGGHTLRRTVLARPGDAVKVWAEDPDTGARCDLTTEEHRAFWAWAAVEVLRHTGIRIEELTELSHHSFVQYTLPATGELIPLLHIAPSKTDSERLLVISPELADVLSAIICRVRDPGGAVPTVAAYDYHERVWNQPMPLLFQRHYGGERRPITPPAICRMLDHALAKTGLTDTSGEQLRFVNIQARPPTWSLCSGV